MADQCYFNGNFYQKTVSTGTGYSPSNTPGVWSKIQIPAEWRWVLTHLTYAHLLEMDGQKDKAEAERTLALTDERRGLDWLIRMGASRERFLDRPEVRQRQFV